MQAGSKRCSVVMRTSRHLELDGIALWLKHNSQVRLSKLHKASCLIFLSVSGELELQADGLESMGRVEDCLGKTE